MPLSNGGKTFPRDQGKEENYRLILNLCLFSCLANYFIVNKLEDFERRVTESRPLDDVAE